MENGRTNVDPADTLAIETAAHQPGPAKPDQSKSQPSSSSGRLEVRCPSCSVPMPVAVDTALTDLTCSSCGSHFSLVDQSQATRMAPPLSKLGRFELIERLGVGGFGSVWKARDKELDRTVAIKIPRAGAMTAEEQEKFFREARAAAQLQHPNIVSVHEVGRDGENVYIVSDFVRGVTLGDWLTGQQLTNREAAKLCAKISEALHHAHEQGVVHRDLKPANIMMDYDGEPHLMDFGLARREAGEVTMTTDGQVLGTPAYMSPEQAEGEAHRADRRSDIYSLGVVLFQLLTGELPFRGNARMLIKQVIHDDPPSPRKLNANISKDLETITLKCLEKDPSRRFSTAQELSQELNRFLVGEPIHSRPISRAARAWRWCRRRPVTAGLSAAVAALVSFVALTGPVVAMRQARLAEAAQRGELAARESQQAAELSEYKARQNAKAAELSEHEARKNAEAAQRLAEAETRARQEAELAQTNLAEAREMAQRIAYARTISLAAREWESANIMQCEDLLDGTRSDLRGWEWDYLKHLCHTENITLRGLGSMPNRFAFHKDGKHLAGFVFSEERVLVWDLESGQIVAQHPFTGWGISRDGTTAVGHPRGKLQQRMRDLDLFLAGRIQIGKSTGVLSVFDVLTGKTISHIAGHAGGISFPHLSEDGSKVATTGHQDGFIRVWDTKTGKELRAFKGPVGDPYFVIALSPDGRRIGWKSPDGWLIVHDVASGEELMKASEGGNWSYPAFNRDGTRLASGTGDEIAIWDVASGQRNAIMHGHRGFVQKFEFSPTEPVLASWGSDNTARLWDVETGRELLCLRGHRRSDRNTFPEIAFNADGTLLATGGSDATIKIWDADAGDSLPKSPSGHGAGDGDNAPLNRREFAPDYRQDLDWLFGHKDAVMDFDFTSDGKSLVSCSRDGTVKLWDIANKRLIRDFAGHSANAWAVCISGDGKLVAAGSGAWDGTQRGKVVVWRRGTGKIVHKLSGHSAAITQLRFTAGGKRLVAGCGHPTQRKGELIIWDIERGEILNRIRAGGSAINGLAVSHDDRAIATCGTDGQIHLWDSNSTEQIRTLGQPGGAYYSVAFSDDGKLLAAGGDSSVAVFDIESGSVVWRKFDHSGAVKDVSFASQDRLVSCGLDGSTRLWDVASGESLLALRDFAGETYRARMSPDGLTLVCGGDDPRLSLRQLPPRSHEKEADWIVLFKDDFERDELGNDWNVVNGNWNIENGVARGELGREAGFNSNAATIATRSPMPENVEVSYDVRSGAGICVETKLVGESQRDWLIASHVGRTGLSHNRGEKGFAVLILTAGSVFHELARKQDDFTLAPDRTYRIRTIRNEGRLRMFVDETLVLEAEVPDGLVANTLQLHAVHGARGEEVYIDNVRVRTPKVQPR